MKSLKYFFLTFAIALCMVAMSGYTARSNHANAIDVTTDYSYTSHTLSSYNLYRNTILGDYWNNTLASNSQYLDNFAFGVSSTANNLYFNFKYQNRYLLSSTNTNVSTSSYYVNVTGIEDVSTTIFSSSYGDLSNNYFDLKQYGLGFDNYIFSASGQFWFWFEGSLDFNANVVSVSASSTIVRTYLNNNYSLDSGDFGNDNNGYYRYRTSDANLGFFYFYNIDNTYVNTYELTDNIGHTLKFCLISVYRFDTYSFSSDTEGAYNDGYSSGSREGYDSGYDNGYHKGSSDGYSNGYQVGYDSGYDVGEQVGIVEGINQANQYTFVGLIGATLDAPINAVRSMFNFEIFGVNITGFLFGLFTITIILVVIKKIRGA